MQSMKSCCFVIPLFSRVINPARLSTHLVATRICKSERTILSAVELNFSVQRELSKLGHIICCSEGTELSLYFAGVQIRFRKPKLYVICLDYLKNFLKRGFFHAFMVLFYSFNE